MTNDERMTKHKGSNSITYSTKRVITPRQFVDVLRRSTLGERPPIDDPKSIRAMLKHTNLLCTAWDGKNLVGVARSLTDFEFVCYLSDIAVDVGYQRRGVGRELIRHTRLRLGVKAKIILLAAPKAEKYYPRIGFEHHHSAWMLKAQTGLR